MAKSVTLKDATTQDPIYPITLLENVFDSNGNNISELAYSTINYTATAVNGSGALTLAGTDPIYVVTVTANISSVALTANPSAGHSCHVLFTAASEYTVAIAHDATNRVCPNAEDLTLTIPAGGYVEVDFLNANNRVYVRGI